MAFPERHIKSIISIITVLTFLYSQVVYAVGYDLFTTLRNEEETQSKFRPPEDVASNEARKTFLMQRQREIDDARHVAFNWSYPFNRMNEEVSRNLYYQKINANRQLAEERTRAENITQRIAAYGEYYIKHKDGMVTWYFNALLTNILGEKVKDKLGHTSIQDTTNMIYNENRQLRQYKQKTKDERNNVTNKIWDSAVYWTKQDSRTDYKKGKGFLAGYHEQTTYPTGEIIDRNVANLTYYTMPDQNLNAAHIEKQIASYNETKTSNQSPDAKTETDWYNSSYLKRPFTNTLLDPLDEEKYPREEDRYDYLLTEFTEETETLDVQTSRTWSNPVYNDNEQLTSYHESIDSLGFHTERDFYEAKYDDWGRITNYKETLNTEGLVTERNWKNGKYNNIDQLTYYEEEVYSGGVWTNTTWDSPIYNSIGQLTSYHTITESGGIQIDTIRSGIIYNSYGLPESYDEVVTSLGMTLETQRRNITYEQHGWTTGWEDSIRETASYVDETGRTVNIDRTYTLRRYDTSYYWNGLIANYRETLIDPLGIITETYRYDMRYNYQGLITGYIEDILKSWLGIEIRTKTIRDNIMYNRFGQMTGYKDIITSNETEGLTTEVSRTDIRYDSLGRITDYTEITHKYAENREEYDTTVMTRRYDIIYNIIGKPVKYKEETINELGTKVTKEWINAKYNPVGLLTSYNEKTIYPDKEIQVSQYKIIYDQYDRVIGYINEETDPYNVLTKTERSQIGYTGQLQNAYLDKMIRTGTNLNQVFEKLWEGEYNKIGQIIRQTETNKDPFSVETVMKMLNMEYTLYGQLKKYDSILTRGNDYVNTKNWQGTYNKLNQINTFNEINTTTDDFTTLKITTNRQGTIYNNLGYIQSYTEKIIDDASALKETERKLYNTTYEKGQLKTYAQEEKAQGVTKTTTRKDTIYNSIGQEQGYTDEIKETNQIDKLLTITKSGITYNEKGRQTQFKEELKETGLNLNYAKTITRASIIFDDFGNITNYTDTIDETSSPNYTTTKTWSGEYDPLGLLEHYEETTKKGNRAEIIVTRDIIYTEKGLQDMYIEITEDKAAPDKPQTKKWIADVYNGYGQLTAYTETIDEGKPTQKITTRTNMEYTNNLLTKYNETIKDETTPDKTTENTWEASYNTIGQVKSYNQTSKEEGTNWDKTITQERNNITYDTQGREYGYTQTEKDSTSSGKTVTTQRKETSYDERGLLLDYKEDISYAGTPDMDYEIEKERKGIIYNTNEQITNYIETQTNKTVSPDKTTTITWEGAGYNTKGQIISDKTVTEETDSLTVTETRTGITYNDKLQITNYKKITESSAAPDLKEETDWTGTYNDLGLLINYSEFDTKEGTNYKEVQKTERAITYKPNGLTDTYIETVTERNPDNTDTINKTTTTTWNNSSYDNLGQVKGYTQKITETAINLLTEKTTTRSGIVYKNGLLTDYIDNTGDISTPGKTTEITWTGGYKPTDGRLTNYTQINQDKDLAGVNIGSPTTITQTGIDYNSNGQLIGYKIETEYPTGLKETITRKEDLSGKGTEYNTLGQLIYFYEEIERSDKPGLSANRTFTVNEYDSSGNMTKYDDVNIDYYGVETEKNMTGVELYDNGLLKKYTETTKNKASPGVTVTVTREDLAYDSANEVRTYTETTNYKGTGLDQTITTSRTQTSYTDGIITGYIEIIDGKTITRSGITYNNNEDQITGYTETKDGITTEWRNITYNDANRIIGYTAGTVKRSDILYNDLGQESSYTEERETADGLKEILQISDTEYNLKGELTGYTDSVTGKIRTDIVYINGKVTSYIETDSRITTARENITYLNNEIISYKDTITDTATPNLTITITRANQTYDSGNLMAYNETVNYKGTGLDKTVERNRTSTTYTDGEETGYTEIRDGVTITRLNITETGYTETKNGVTTIWSNITYNNKDQVIGYTAGSLSRSNITYNNLGQEVSYTEIKGGIATEWSGITYNSENKIIGYTKGVVTRSNIQYNGLGQEISYTETEKGITTEWKNITYNGNNQIIGYTAGGVTRSNIQYNGLGQAILYTETDNSVTTTYSGITYNDAEEVTGYTDGSVTRSNIQYNESGQVVSYTEAESGDTVNRQNMTYNSENEISGYTEIIIKNGITTTTKREDIIYDDSNRITSYKDTIIDSTTDNLEKVVTVSQVMYNEKSEITGYTENIQYTDIRSKPKFDGLTIDKTYSDITYDSNGNEITKVELITRSDKPDIQYTITITGNMQDGFTKILEEKNLLTDEITTTTLTQTNMEYIDGLLTGYNQVITDFIGTYTINYSEAEYNDAGQILFFTSEISDYEGAITTIEFSDPKYNPENQLNSYEILITDPDDSETEITWDRGLYNSIGQLTRYRLRGNGPTENWSGETFSDKGQYIDFRSQDILGANTETLHDLLPEDIVKPIYKEEEPISENKVDASLLSQILNMFKNAPSIKFTQEILKKITATHINLLMNTYYNALITQRSLTPQPIRENAAILKELPDEQGLELEITNRLETRYNTIGQVTSYTEKITQIGGTWGRFGELNTITQEKTVSRSDIAYNTFGQLIGYSESETNDKGVEKTLERNNITYTELGLTEKYSEERFELGIQKNEDVSNLTYNEEGQLMAYYSVLKEQGESMNGYRGPIKYEQTTITERLSTDYGLNGQITGLKETIWNSGTPGLLAVTEKIDIAYNIFGQVSGLKEIVTTPFESITTTKSNLEYIPGGNLVSFQEEIKSTVAPDLVTIHNWSGARYSERGELKEYSETYRKKGSDLIKQIRKTGITYDILGRITGYTLKERDYSPLLDTTKTTIRKEMVYNALHELLGYTDETTQGDITEIVRFGNAEYDIAGRLLKYIKETQATGQAVSTQERLSTIYNEYGQITAYEDKIIKQGITQLLTAQNIQYNGMGQTLSYTQNIHITGGTLDYTETTQRQNSVYDSYGRLKDYNEIDSDTNKQVSLSYNIYDQLITQTELGAKYGDAYEYGKINMQYDINGRLVSYNEMEKTEAESRDARMALTYNNLNQIINRNEQGIDRKGSYTINTIDIEYNNVGQQKTFTQTKTQNNITETTTRLDTKYNDQGLADYYSEETINALGLKASRSVSAVTYDNQSRISKYTEAGIGEDSTAYNLNRAGIQYDSKQRISSFEETGYNPQTGNYGYTRNSIAYDQFNRITNYAEQGSSLQTGNYNLSKTLAYDNLDRLINTTETGSRQNGGNYNNNRVINEYDLLGRVTKFTEIGGQQGEGAYNLTRSNITYDKSNITSYMEEGNQEGRGSYRTEKTNMKYTNGQLTSFHEKTNSSDGSEVEFDRNITYNANGQIIGYTETGTRKGQGNYTVTKTDITYNNIGQIVDYKETGTNWEGGYSYRRYEINYSGEGRITSYKETGKDAKGKDYSLHRYSMNYDGAGRLTSYSENNNDGHRDVFSMSYNANGQLISQQVRSDKDQFQFGGNSTYSFSYDGNGNLSGSRIDTNDYWATFDAKGSNTGTGFSAQMQNYINEMQRQAQEAQRRAEEAERDAQNTIRDAERKMQEAIEEEARAEEEAYKNIIFSDGKVRDYYESWKRHEDLANQAARSGNRKDEKYHRNKAQVRKEQFEKQAARVARAYADRIKQEAQQKRNEAERLKQEAGRSVGSAKSEAQRKASDAENKAREAEQRANNARAAAERAKQMAISLEKKLQGQDKSVNVQTSIQKTPTLGLELKVTKIKEQDGSTTVKIYNPITGNTRLLKFDSFGDTVFKQVKDISGATTHLETHSFTRDAGGSITSDDYYKKVTSVTAAKEEQVSRGITNAGTRTTVEELGHLTFNKFGQITSADITRNVIVLSDEILNGKNGNSKTRERELANYTQDIHMETTQDGLGRVTQEHETTHIFGSYTTDQKQKTAEKIDVTITRDKSYDYSGDSLLPSGWNETIKRSDQNVTQENTVWDIKYNAKGQMEEYRERSHTYGETTKPDGTIDKIDLIQEKYRYNILYNQDNRISAYREIRQSNDKPGLVQMADVMNIAYSTDGLMSGYTEILNQYGFSTGDEANAVWMSVLNDPNMISNIATQSDNLIFSNTITTTRSNLVYDSLNQITGYTDTITHPNGKQETVTMEMSYRPTGELSYYHETRISADLNNPDKTETTETRLFLEYDEMGRISEKQGEINGESYEVMYREFDAVGRPVVWTEEISETTQTHYNVIYNSLGEISIEFIKTSAESGGLFSSSEETLNEFNYTYDKTGERNIAYQNEIYHNAESSILGTIFQAAVSAVAAVFTAGQSLWVTAAWMAATSFVTTLAVTGDIETALLSGAISFATSVATSFIQGAVTGTLDAVLAPAVERTVDITFSNFAKEFTKQLITSEVYDQVSARGPPALAYLASAIAGGLLSYALPMDVLSNTHLSLAQIFSPQAIANHLINAGIIQLIDIAVDNGTITAQTASVLRTLASAFVSAMTYNVAEQTQTKATIEELKQKGYEPIYNERGNIAGWIKGEDTSVIYLNADGSFKYEQSYDSNANLIAIKEPGKTTYYDTNLTPIYAILDNGTIQSYDIYGDIEGILPSGATAQFDDNGNFIGSNNESVFGTRYYGTNGQEEAWIPEGYTVRTNENGDIIGSYKNAGEGATIYRDTDGKFQYWTRESANGETYIHDGNTVTNLHVDGITDWTKTNTPFSVINYYDADGQKITAQLMTKLDENGFIQNKIYHDLTTDEFTLYDRDGNDLGTYKAKTNSKGEIAAYYGYNKDNTFRQLDPNLNPVYEITQEGKYIQYGINPEKIEFILNPDTAYLVTAGDQIRFALGYDPQKDKFTLYDSMGKLITDNPVMLAAKLNVRLLTMPTEIAQKIINDAKAVIALAYSQIHKDDSKLYAGNMPLSAREIAGNISAWAWHATMQTVGFINERIAIPFQLLDIGYNSFDNVAIKYTGQDINEWNLKAIAGTTGTPCWQDDALSLITKGINEGFKGLPFVIGSLTSLSRAEKIAGKIIDTEKAINKTDALFIYDAKLGRFRSTETGRFVAKRNLPWPSQDGFISSARGTLDTGTIVDRFGRSSGQFAADLNTSISERGLVQGMENMEYHRYQVLKPIEVEMGPAASIAEFGADGKATQYRFDKTIQELIDEGILKEIE